MKILYKDLINFFQSKPSKELLSEQLFQLGHENTLSGEVIEMDLTPNRGDCLSVLGIARDLSAFHETNLQLEVFEGEIEELNINFKNLSTKDCPKISFLEIEIDQVPDKYHDYLDSYFVNLNINKNNFFTDISNYLSYELGQPTHCYDSKKLDGVITFESKECKEQFKTLLDTDINLSGTNSVFINNKEIISLAGVMGGKKTSCSNETKKTLVECAFFNPESIIGKSIKYNIQSDASHKFERGVDINSHELVLRRFIKIVQDHAKIVSIKWSFFEEKVFKNIELNVDVNRINSILGTSIKENFYKKLLEKIGFKIVDEKIIVPSHRNDISTQNDLAEEAARILGYNNIENKPLSIYKNQSDSNNSFIEDVKRLLSIKGFNEVINFPFVADNLPQSISIDNPLDSNKKYLRLDLKKSLIDNLLYNERRQKDSIKIFEISDVYSSNEKISQKLKLGVIASGRQGHNHNSFQRKIDQDYLKNQLKDAFDTKKLDIQEISRAGLDTKVNNKIFYFETILEESVINKGYCEPNAKEEIHFNKYKKISEFPSSTRDFSFSISRLSKYDDVIEHLLNLNHEYLKDSFIFDFYKNEKLGEVKLGIRLIFQSNDRTLSEKEIQTFSNILLEPIIKLDGVSIPGMTLKINK
tara:strand:- start:5507 stop:7429 length:1923 start_codon:yes stop_codon:yes gene_type:complete